MVRMDKKIRSSGRVVHTLANVSERAGSIGGGAELISRYALGGVALTLHPSESIDTFYSISPHAVLPFGWHPGPEVRC